MIFSYFCFIFFFSLALAQEPLSCTQEGQETQLAAGYFLCKGGVYVPTACSSDGVRVEIGANFTKPNYYYVFECRNVSQYSIHLVPVACKQQDKTIQPGESYVFQSFWFTCVQKAPGVLQLQASGCVTETGEKVTANNTYKTKDFVYNCFTKADGSVYTHPQVLQFLFKIAFAIFFKLQDAIFGKLHLQFF